LHGGNVHAFADGHGMTVEDFVLSADVSAEHIAKPACSLGARIFNSVQATQQAVACNTNLGIILLCAPMMQARLTAPNNALQPSIHGVLGHASIEDAEQVFAAIRLAKPAGLGVSETFDVLQPANGTLLQAMQAAAHRDLIAQQYVTNYADVYTALALYERLNQQWQRPAWAATGVHLYFMSQFLDSHIVRKQGEIIAKMVQSEAIEHYHAFLDTYNPKNYLVPLLHFDAALKSRGLNPGTSADLTVATLLLQRLA
jgi:triphosphoribosyl-dephospho-CoA synthase